MTQHLRSIAECWCKGNGQGRWTRSDTSISAGHMEFCPCPVGKEHGAEYAENLERSRAESYRQLQVHRWEKASNIPPRYTQCRLTTSPLSRTHPALVKALTWVPYPYDEEDEDSDAGFKWWETFGHRVDRSWFFWGPYGTGKTGLAISYAHERIFKDLAGNDYGEPYYIHFTTIPDLLTELRSTYNKTSDKTEAEVLEFYQHPDCLILDDLGAEQVSNTGWVEDRLYQIIGHRHGEEKQIIFTSNLSLTKLAGRIGERITWRIIEMCGKENIVEIKGANLRDIV